MALNDQIFEVISKKGFNPVKGNVYKEMAKYKSWYRGNVNNFHSYNIKVSGETVKRKRLSLQMAKKVCEDWATLLFNEEVELNIKDNDTLNNNIQDVLDENNFRVEFAQFLEKTFALGTGVTVEFIQDGEVIIDYILGEYVIVTSYRNQKINGICAINSFKQGDNSITHLAYHTYVKGVYTIEHEVYKSDKEGQLGRAVQLNSVFNTDIEEETIVIETKQPHFQVYKPNIANNFELENPMGMSIFANSIDTLMAIDKKYDSFANEFDAARHRIMVPEEFTKTQAQASESSPNIKYINYFDKEQMEYQAVPMGEQADIKFYNAEIRTQQHIDALNRELQTLGFKCGLGTDYYAFDSRGVYQNEKAIVSENSDLWASKKKHEIILKKGLKGIMQSIAYLLTGKDIKVDDVEVKLADSIVIDDEALKEADKDLMDRQMLPEYKYLMKWYGLTEQEAKEQIEEAQQIDEVDTELETQEEFIERFMEEKVEEYPDEQERLEKANQAWIETNEQT